MGSVVSFIQHIKKVTNPPEVQKATGGVLRCGILGAALIAPDAIITPAKSHPEITIYAVASRGQTKAEAFAKKHHIPKPSGLPPSELLDDPEVDVIYNPLPNALHYEWTLKALKAGKHVLLEKPSTDTADDTKALFDYAKEKGLVLLEAFHSRFHPAINRVKEIVDSGELGKIKNVSANFDIPTWTKLILSSLTDDNFRFDFDLGGGALMDMGCYPLAMIRYVTSTEPTEVLEARADPLPNPKDEPHKRNIDIGTTALFAFPDDITASLDCHQRRPSFGPFLIPRLPAIDITVECENGTVALNNYIGPHVYNHITVTPKGDKAKERIETAYKFPDGLGEDWWSTYRYQLEFFVDKVKGRQPRLWMDADDSTLNMKWIEKIYEKTGLGSRPKSTFSLSSQ